MPPQTRESAVYALIAGGQYQSTYMHDSPWKDLLSRECLSHS